MYNTDRDAAKSCPPSPSMGRGGGAGGAGHSEPLSYNYGGRGTFLEFHASFLKSMQVFRDLQKTENSVLLGGLIFK